MPRPRTPLLTVDVIIELSDRPEHPIVLIRRRNPPPGWALPGGFVDEGESTEAAAMREAKEETGLATKLVALLGCYSDPDRDPRGYTASAVYVAHAAGIPRGADDAAEARAFAPPDFPQPLAFDHGRILNDYLTFRRTGQPAPLRAPEQS
ncbi:MAG: NUDIX hydrolase [Gammaproteobacteria bacterium]|nr:NUDIX hydrolase [Gammaproteobacteria bacterium]MDJ0890438.1 NUDIX hydrolase [Gammaproteobacteria bacterium]